MIIRIVKPSNEEVRIYLKLVLCFFIFISIGIITTEYQLNKLTLTPELEALNLKQDVTGSKLYILGNSFELSTSSSLPNKNLPAKQLEKGVEKTSSWYDKINLNNLTRKIEEAKGNYKKAQRQVLPYALEVKDKQVKVSNNIKPYIAKGKDVVDIQIKKIEDQIRYFNEKR